MATRHRASILPANWQSQDSKFPCALSSHDRNLSVATRPSQYDYRDMLIAIRLAKQRIGAAFSPRHWTIRGNLVLPRPACAPWRDGGKLLSCRPGSSCACEIRVPSIACAGWVGMYAWAKYLAPDSSV